MTRYLFWDDEIANSKQYICSVGYVCMDENGNEFFRNYELIDPESDFGFFERGIHGISDDDVAGKRSFETFYKEAGLSDILANCVPVAHNARSADLSHIRKSLERYGLDMPEVQYIDTREMSETLGEAASGGLPEVCECYGVALGSHHNAFDDALACSEIFWRMVEKLGAIPETKTYVPGVASASQRKPRRRRPYGTLGLVNGSEQTIEELLEELDGLGLLADIDEIVALGPCSMKFSGVANGMSSNEIENTLQCMGYGSGKKKTVTGNPGKRTVFFAVGDNVGTAKIEAAKKNGVRVVALADLLDALAD